MDFLIKWKNELINNECDSKRVRVMLNKEEPVERLIESGSEAEMAELCSIIMMIPFRHFYECIKSEDNIDALIASDVPCFSTFGNGAYRLNEILLFEPDGLTFADIGYQMVKAEKVTARIKYGENHAKLARMMNLVTISKTKPFVVKNTSLGGYVIKMPQNERDKILKIMLLQNKFVKCFICNIQEKAMVRYRDIVSCLSDSTAYRRKTSVKQVMEFLLIGTAEENKLKKIDWTV